MRLPSKATGGNGVILGWAWLLSVRNLSDSEAAHRVPDARRAVARWQDNRFTVTTLRAGAQKVKQPARQRSLQNSRALRRVLLTVPTVMTIDETSARFFDEHRQDSGWASKVTLKVRRIGGLTTLDVTTTEPELVAFLSALDRSPLRVQSTGLEGESYTFAWASGYENGRAIRVQGVLIES